MRFWEDCQILPWLVLNVKFCINERTQIASRLYKLGVRWRFITKQLSSKQKQKQRRKVQFSPRGSLPVGWYNPCWWTLNCNQCTIGGNIVLTNGTIGKTCLYVINRHTLYQHFIGFKCKMFCDGIFKILIMKSSRFTCGSNVDGRIAPYHNISCFLAVWQAPCFAVLVTWSLRHHFFKTVATKHFTNWQFCQFIGIVPWYALACCKRIL